MSNNARIQAVLFDLDGTLADTSPDMTDALNLLLTKYNRPTLEYDFVRNHTSRGSIAMIQLGFKEKLEKEHSIQLRNEFLQLYAENLCNQTKLFPGVDALLDSLDEKEIPWGIRRVRLGGFVPGSLSSCSRRGIQEDGRVRTVRGSWN